MTATTIAEVSLSDAEKQELQKGIKMYMVFALALFVGIAVLLAVAAGIFSLFYDLEAGWEARCTMALLLFLAVFTIVVARLCIPLYRDIRKGVKLCITGDNYEIVKKKREEVLRFRDKAVKDISITHYVAEALNTELPVIIEITPRARDVIAVIQNDIDISAIEPAL